MGLFHGPVCLIASVNWPLPCWVRSHGRSLALNKIYVSVVGGEFARGFPGFSLLVCACYRVCVCIFVFVHEWWCWFPSCNAQSTLRTIVKPHQQSSSANKQRISTTSCKELGEQLNCC